ncbi:membrane cofactor protein-like [Protopterus annectens]|uniref:membrane cofactor protein-like n=1 Tax=Protopterus annectens TaxID=7888 RepID=UPI001CFA9DD4|nr:membrane cofactor protein-like [Protopterus annectens]
MVRWRSSFCCILLLSSIAGSQEFDECDEPPRSQSAKLEEISQNNFPINTVLTYSCRPGYKAVPGISNSITCQENLSWSILQEFCKPHDCGTVPDLPNGKINYPSGFTTFSSEAIMSCNEGYRLNGRTKRTCLSDGWDNGNPTCVPVMCPKAEVKDGQTVYENGPENQFNTSVSIKCNEGFTLRGSLVAACNKDGQWDPPLPNCEVITCPKPAVKHGLKINQTGPDNQLNTSVTFECNEGFTLRDSSIAMCNKYGLWDPPLPTCESESSIIFMA